MGLLHFLRNFHTVFHSGYTILHSHWQGINFPVSPYPHQHLLSPGFLFVLDTGPPNRNEAVAHWEFNLHFLMISNVRHLFMHLLPHLCIFSGETSVQALCPFFNRIIYMFATESCEFFFILETYLLSDTCLAKIFSHSISCHYIYFFVYFCIPLTRMIFSPL